MAAACPGDAVHSVKTSCSSTMCVQGLVAEDVTNLTELSRRRADAAKHLQLSPPWQVDCIQELQTRCAPCVRSRLQI